MVAAAWTLIRVFDWLSGGGGPLAWVGVKRVVFSDPRDALPVPLVDFPTQGAALNLSLIHI